VYSNPASGDCSYTEDDNMFTILNDGLLIQTNLDELVCYGTDDASISVKISKLEPSTFYSVNWTRLDPVTNTPDGYEKIQVFSTTENHNSSKEPKTLSASSLVSGKYKVEVWQNDDPSCRYEFENMEIKSIKPVQIISQPLDEVAAINGTFATFNDVFGDQFEYSIDSDGDGIADNSDGGFVIPPTCDEFVNDGEIKVQILGNEYLNREIKWYSYQLGDNCLTYLIKAKDSDSDGVADYADADVDGDGIPNAADIDQTGGTDADGDGIDDIADVDQTAGTDNDNDGIDDSFNTLDADKDGILNDADLDPNDPDITTISLNNSLGIVTYQNCASDFINVNLTHQISQSGGITICAKPGQVVLDADASAFFTLSGGTQSCSLSSWVELPDFEGINYLKNLNEGKYKVVVTEIDSENPQRTCTYEKEIELVRDAVKYENVRIDENICLGETGVVTIDLISFVGVPTFYYEGVEATGTKLPSNNSTIEISSYEITISPVENGVLIVSNSEGCNTIIDPSLIYNDFSDPEFTYTSESYELYNVIPKNELVRFEVTSNLTNYTSIEWDFGDVTSIEYGDKVFHSFSADGIYDVKLTVSNDAGCSKEIVEQITIGDGYLLMVPNVFTPNNDGKNDVFIPKFSGFINISMRIFNAYGNLLHESAESGGDDGAGNIIKPEIIPWDGSNADLNSKMYIYQINGVIINGEAIEKTGTIQILW
jgi:gliding motility-associated-like protein